MVDDSEVTDKGGGWVETKRTVDGETDYSYKLYKNGIVEFEISGSTPSTVEQLNYLWELSESEEVALRNENLRITKDPEDPEDPVILVSSEDDEEWKAGSEDGDDDGDDDEDDEDDDNEDEDDEEDDNEDEDDDEDIIVEEKELEDQSETSESDYLDDSGDSG